LLAVAVAVEPRQVVGLVAVAVRVVLDHLQPKL
jgi:hypothetical protein